MSAKARRAFLPNYRPDRTMKKLILFALTALFTSAAQAQQQEYKPLDAQLQLKTSHLWRGIEVADEVTTVADISVKDPSEVFKFGLWGGAGINGNYKEIDYYASISKYGLTLTVWDIYNFSPGATYNNRQAFNYKARETGHFVDASLAWRVCEQFPLRLYWATVLFGRDRGPLNDRNLYSTYVEVSYPFKLKGGIGVELSAGGAFSMRKGKNADGTTSDAHFYGKTPGVVSCCLNVTKDVKIGSYTLPVSVLTMWNPENNTVNAQVALTLLTF